MLTMHADFEKFNITSDLNKLNFSFLVLYQFYCRAMLCICAVNAVVWCLSVCPVSVTFVYCVETAKDKAI